MTDASLTPPPTITATAKWPSDSSVAHASHTANAPHIHSAQPPSLLKLSGKKVYLACGKTDMRKSINGLSEIVVSTFNLDLFGGALFVFCNGCRNRLKILVWDGDGFWLLFKRLEKGRFRWPAAHSEATMTLTAEELSILLGGARVELKLRRNEVFGRKFY
jgi:transposase